MLTRKDNSASSNSGVAGDSPRPLAAWRPDLVRASFCLLAGICAGLLLQFSPISQELMTRIDLPLLYRARGAVGSAQPLASNVKLVLFDDMALSYTGASEPSLDQLADVISLIASRSPSVIVLNKVFSVPPVGSTPATVRRFVQRVRDVQLRQGIPVVAAVYFTGEANPERVDLRNQPGFRGPSSLYGPGLAPSTWGLDEALSLQGQIEELGFPSRHINDNAGSFLFGPGRDLLDAFSGLGVAAYDPSGRAQLFYSAGGGIVIPHIALTPFPVRSLGEGFVQIGDARAPVNYRGEMLPDFISRETIRKRSLSMTHLLNPDTSIDAASKTISSGDIVLVIPNAISANFSSARILSPLGWMSDYHVHASVISNFISGRFVRESHWPVVWIFLATFLSVAIAGMLRPGLAFASVVGFSAFWFGVAALLFAWSGLAIPCTVPVAAALIAGVVLVSRKAAAAEALAIKLAAAFDGRITNQTLESISRNPNMLNVGSREVPVSIMFIDVAGFSLFAERNKAQDVFKYLRELIREASGMVNEFGGVVDKSLGDGLLAHFGYDLENPGDQLDHANRAFECAVRIQESHLFRNQKALSEGTPVLPLRIGVNTATCMLGDLGTDKRMDITIVGGGVNFAKRLEDACEPGTILVSSTTATLAAQRGKNSALIRKFVRVKHMNALVEAFEYDPLAHAPHLKVKLMEAFRTTVASDRVDRRWIVPDACRISLRCELGVCEMVNFSGRGFAARLPAAFARGSRISFEIESATGPGGGERLMQDLSQAGITTIDAEVRWCHGTGGNVVHGFSIHGFSEDQCSVFGRAFLDFCFAEEEFKLPRIG